MDLKSLKGLDPHKLQLVSTTQFNSKVLDSKGVSAPQD
jgi:hypothetical protein